MYNITIQNLTTFATKQREFETLEEATAKFDQGVAAARKVKSDRRFQDAQPLKRSAVMESQSADYVMNLYRF